jgi:hypothetical protein
MYATLDYCMTHVCYFMLLDELLFFIGLYMHATSDYCMTHVCYFCIYNTNVLLDKLLFFLGLWSFTIGIYG